MHKTIGITGSVKGINKDQAIALESLIDASWRRIHHGGRSGTDMQVVCIAFQMLDGVVDIFCHPGPPSKWDEWNELNNLTDEVRSRKESNRRIVDACDELLIFPRRTCFMSFRAWHMVWWAIRQGKRTTIVWPDGRIQRV